MSVDSTPITRTTPQNDASDAPHHPILPGVICCILEGALIGLCFIGGFYACNIKFNTLEWVSITGFCSYMSLAFDIDNLKARKGTAWGKYKIIYHDIVLVLQNRKMHRRMLIGGIILGVLPLFYHEEGTGIIYNESNNGSFPIIVQVIFSIPLGCLMALGFTWRLALPQPPAVLKPTKIRWKDRSYLNTVLTGCAVGLSITVACSAAVKKPGFPPSIVSVSLGQNEVSGKSESVPEKLR